MTVTTPDTNREAEADTFVETALKLSGKSAEEARTTGALDRAVEQVETLFSRKYQTTWSTVHRAVWEDELPGELFVAKDQAVPDATQLVMLKSLETIRERCGQKTVFDAQGKISPETLTGLAEAGYWGLLVDKEYSGQGAPFQAFAKFITQMATVDATVAGLASVHGCIGAVDPLRTFGSLDSETAVCLPSWRRANGFRPSSSPNRRQVPT